MIAHDERALRIVAHFRLCMTNLGFLFGLLLGLFFVALDAPGWLWVVFLVMAMVRTLWHYHKWARE